ncbi:hypothetical protein SAMN06265222_107262 [Neorhodopirellula lusitana]|uniref:Transmembrane protein n=1 Tax=Neorhodopirellula lusitana TaxID=445327 RepID=A0ABY1Q8N3_9BACT|nr:hypothetical protein [Neorhodopirellula lusitana]SMP62205.1 hypothetical protein SAMN06265222_107262 [Neorhodopirellula lusitana]
MSGHNELPDRHQSSDSNESVQDLVARLGTPPHHVVMGWLEEAQRICAECGRQAPNPDPATFDASEPVWRSFYVEANGGLSGEFAERDGVSLPDDSEPEGFGPHGLGKGGSVVRGASVAGPPGLLDQAVVPVADDSHLNFASEEEGDGNREETADLKSGRRLLSPLLGIAVVAVLVTVVGAAAWWFGDGPIKTAGRSSQNASSDVFNANVSDGEVSAGELPKHSESDSLSSVFDSELVDAASVGDSVSADAGSSSMPVPLNMGLSLDAFLPPSLTGSLAGSDTSGSSSDDLGQLLNGDDVEGGEQDVAGSTNLSSDNRGLGMIDGEASIDGEVSVDGQPGDELVADLTADDTESDSDLEAEAREQPTIQRSSNEPKTQSVELPRPFGGRSEIAGGGSEPDTDAVDLFKSDSSPNSWSLDFPDGAKTLVLDDESNEQQEVGSRFRDVVVAAEQTPIARFQEDPNQSGNWFFLWRYRENASSIAGKLPHGRIQTPAGETIFLRPELDADPVPLSLQQRDQKLKWNLHAGVPPGATTLQVNVTVPKEVEVQWLEPFADQSPRKARGVATLSLTSSSETAIVVRMDIRTTNTLSMRMRFGARLDPAMPWQWTDAKQIRQSFQQVTSQLEAADRQLLELDVAITRADRMRARRQEAILEERRDRIDEAVKGWTMVAKRLADLDQLVAFLDAGGSVMPELVVEWPDTRQVIFRATEKE